MNENKDKKRTTVSDICTSPRKQPTKDIQSPGSSAMRTLNLGPTTSMPRISSSQGKINTTEAKKWFENVMKVKLTDKES